MLKSLFVRKLIKAAMCPERLWVSHLQRHPKQVRWGSGQFDLKGGNPAHGRGLELDDR